MIADRTFGAWARGRLLMAGVVDSTPFSDVLDMLTVIYLEVPRDPLRQWRRELDRADLIAKAKAGRLDRSTWGLQPHQIEQQRAAMRTLGQSGE